MPNLIPEWMEQQDAEGNLSIKNNGIWTNTTLNIPELIATYMKVWLEDSVPTDLIESIKESTGQYTSEKQVEAITSVYAGLVENRKAEIGNLLATLEQQYTELTESVTK
jgi:hypothetical protein